VFFIDALLRLNWSGIIKLKDKLTSLVVCSYSILISAYQYPYTRHLGSFTR